MQLEIKGIHRQVVLRAACGYINVVEQHEAYETILDRIPTDGHWAVWATESIPDYRETGRIVQTGPHDFNVN